ncbi:hypothetical protein HMPREF0484_1034 [Klebsiella pneumoniae subsp. rhinoscleromatis ATCC 13884]|nr:hypothetical protein HMPREF0484_1034 [Klebsiella pneumoniae subsp. rhinoscleromatis ATCC 13884]STT68578.1 Uncharacterised protein [Klebsiella pneumoniae]STV63692.1 Uncharacterised protein [Klebsiella pneumoniae subsp. rhinoscleromatis]STU10692.1 Uncharacterised protein [Klebsiella pneumoniae]STW03449.1 Uncharacterised protein [Klebsiella pneumoniae subsp. rhinoscleromatis]
MIKSEGFAPEELLGFIQEKKRESARKNTSMRKMAFSKNGQASSACRW